MMAFCRLAAAVTLKLSSLAGFVVLVLRDHPAVAFALLVPFAITRLPKY